MKSKVPVAVTTSKHLADVIERNIAALTEVHEDNTRARKLREKISDGITAFSGHLNFVYLHIAWFGVWLLLNSGRAGIKPFDPYPYGLLTMIVSLEAIFLSTFVLISQNRLCEEADRRADLALQMGLLSEHEITRVLNMLDAIQDKLGIENESDNELRDLEQEVFPEDVLKEIARVHQEARVKKDSRL